MGVYIPNPDGTFGYVGNRIFKSMDRISQELPPKLCEDRVDELRNGEVWDRISRINHRIEIVTNAYFDEIGSLFALLPQTTRMISSPGAVYGKEKLHYTQDSVPIKLKWFDLDKEVYLSESSQIYLELYLISKNLRSVYAIYNSFRKEQSDATHLAEFHHIEFEGKITQTENKKIALGLLARIINELLRKNKEDLAYFLYDEDIDYLKKFSSNKKGTELTFEQALDLLYRSTKNSKYKKFTSKYFGAWEEVKLSSEVGDMTLVSEYPLYEVAFYHAPMVKNGNEVADNTDIIWPAYREIIGSGGRVKSLRELELKAKKFNLPREDYKIYFASRKPKDYQQTSGFGLGWERMLQGLLKMPYIHSVSAFPRVHSTIYP